MEEDNLNNAIVRIISHDVEYDWNLPYKISDDTESVGTGFFVNMQGIIITCFHVVQSSIKLFVNIPDEGKKKYEAKIVSICPSLDIAILEVVDYKPKLSLKIGNSDKARPGDPVTALGYPLGQEHIKYTAGIISGRQYGDIQTDAPINPGNSGGPLLNKDSEVVGINSSGVSAFIADNIGYATPIHNVNVLLKNMNNSSVDKGQILCNPVLGCTFCNNSADSVKIHKLNTKDRGYIVSLIVQESSLYKAGIRSGDIIFNFNDLELDNYGECAVCWSSEKEHITDIMKRYTIFDDITIKYYSIREKKYITKGIDFSLNYRPKIRKVFPKFEKVGYEIFAGLIFMELSANHFDIFNSDVVHKYNEQFRFIENQQKKRVIISHVFSGSSINKVENLEAGHIVSFINGMKVYDLSDVKKAILRTFKQGFIFIKTSRSVQVTILLENIKEEDAFLREQYKYDNSDYLKEYLEGK